MDPKLWQKIDALFQEIVDLSPEEHRARLAAESDDEIRQEVADMLAALDNETLAADPLDHIVYEGVLTDEPMDSAPEKVGPYRLVKEIGRGGMATVYLAEREGEYSRRVAVKLIRRGVDTDDILARLRLERQILAHLDHPYIARMYEGGTTEDNRPYFVMEAIEGQRIDQWCDERALDLNQRLELFRKVCEAVAYAHQNLVLHRDIKPSNLLVTEEGSPKLLDFGIAKVLQGSGNEQESGSLSAIPTMTGPDERLLTPEFASPEQVRGETLTTGSDVYALGVLLYRLITGGRPYEMDRRRLDDVIRVVSEVEPERPSAKIRRAAKQDDVATVPAGWPRGSRAEDLDNIVLMALRKEPHRRYGNVRQLSEDLRCFREDLPVTARRDTLKYRATKFIRRHRASVALVTMVFLLLTTAAIVATHQAKIARQERAFAQQERAFAEEQQIKAETVAGFLQELLQGSDPFVAAGKQVSLRQLLDSARRQIETELEGAPLIKAELMITMANAYDGQGLFDEAEQLFEASSAIFRQGGEEAERGLAGCLVDFGRFYVEQESHDRAEELLQEALAWYDAQGEESADSIKALLWSARSRVERHDYTAAEPFFERALSWRAQTREDEKIWAELVTVYGEYWLERGLPEKAIPPFERALAIYRRIYPYPYPLTLDVMGNLALAQRESNQATASLELFEELLARKREIFGERNAQTSKVLTNYGVALRKFQRPEEALEKLQEALEINLETHGEIHPAVARSYRSLSLTYRSMNRFESAMEEIQKALKVDRAFYGENDARVVQDMLMAADLAGLLGDPRAEDQLLKVLEIRRRTLPETHPRLASVLVSLGKLRLQWGRAEEAEPVLLEALHMRTALFGPDDKWVAQAQEELGRCMLELGRYEEAQSLLTSALRIFSETLGPEHNRALAVQEYLDRLNGRPTEAHQTAAS